MTGNEIMLDNSVRWEWKGVYNIQFSVIYYIVRNVAPSFPMASTCNIFWIVVFRGKSVLRSK